jgi:hypothetical protein
MLNIIHYIKVAEEAIMELLIEISHLVRRA